ncbi:MAG TPA: PilZ domain-containing protein [Polyangiales bacterium]|nr:PilZ domain-containing protein [Polyangiales bacterium]
MQRRDHTRYQLWFPVQLESSAKPTVAMTHNIGAGGMLMALSRAIEVDELVVVTFRLPPPSGREYSLRGRVLRIESNSADPEGGWPYRIAVAFDEVAPELMPYLEDAQRFGQMS